MSPQNSLIKKEQQEHFSVSKKNLKRHLENQQQILPYKNSWNSFSSHPIVFSLTKDSSNSTLHKLISAGQVFVFVGYSTNSNFQDFKKAILNSNDSLTRKTARELYFQLNQKFPKQAPLPESCRLAEIKYNSKTILKDILIEPTLGFNLLSFEYHAGELLPEKFELVESFPKETQEKLAALIIIHQPTQTPLEDEARKLVPPEKVEPEISITPQNFIGQITKGINAAPAHANKGVALTQEVKFAACIGTAVGVAKAANVVEGASYQEEFAFLAENREMLKNMDSETSLSQLLEARKAFLKANIILKKKENRLSKT